MRIFFGWVAVAGVACGLAAEEKALPPATSAQVDFSKHIAPILQNHCLACHGPDKAKSGLRLDSLETTLKGGYSGAVVKPGKSADSRLIHLVAGLDKDDVIMPPKEKKPLSKEDIGLLRAWIDQGAKWPKDVTLIAKDQPATTKVRHWSFQPIRRPTIPDVKQRTWVRNPIDHFILSKLEAEGIAPSATADRPTLIRRVSLDLIGLPPTPAEVIGFVKDTRPDAYERLVDRLLNSPHYGEKWARPWLDLCHYADTDGYLTDQLRPVAWRYRQWLVDALNRDMPFDQFTIQQLAGDLLPNAGTDQKLATGFLRNTLSNREGGADLEEFRVEQVVDRVHMMATTWLGLTVGCARCHDHKYDPISQKEFFQLFAYFDSADEVNVDAPLPGEREPYVAKKSEYDRKRAELIKPVAKELAELEALWEKKMLAAVAQPSKDHVWDRQWEVLGLIWGGNLGEGQLEGTQIVLLDPTRRSQDQKDRLLDYFLQNGAVTDGKRFAELKLAELHKQLEKLKAELPKVTRAPAMMETMTPRDTHLHVRGEFRTKGIKVSKGTPAILPPLPSHAEPHRLGLARWLVSPDNPLSARVTVNRAWQEFFGQGLVLTSENFGTQGAHPSHPELLDWLGREFVGEPGASAPGETWSMKRMHRLIVTSATYQQSSRARPELVGRDPANVWLARQNSLRFTSDQVRDVTLAVSGLLNDKIGGPCVFPRQPDAVAMEGFDNKWEESKGRDRHRRSLYTWLQRLSPFAQNVTFDAPTLSRSCTRRERSNTPLQALTLLNDPVFFEAAQALAKRLIREEKSYGTDKRLHHAFLLALSRPPSRREKERLSAYVTEQFVLHSGWAVSSSSLSGPHAIDPSELAIWTGVASVLLNLHEFITRD